MIEFTVQPNRFLRTATRAFSHTDYVGHRKPGNPDYLNELKNTFNDRPLVSLSQSQRQLRGALRADLPSALDRLGTRPLMACVVPRAKAEENYEPTQMLFRATIREALGPIQDLLDGCDHIRRHTSTRTTHLRNPVANYINDGDTPYPGITARTCHIAEAVRGQDILLVDDIYTAGVNIDEDAIQALLDAGARSVALYVVARTLQGGRR